MNFALISKISITGQNMPSMVVSALVIRNQSISSWQLVILEMQVRCTENA